MGYVLPGWLDEILDFIGINWPNVDEDDYREMADAMRELADAFDEHAGEAHLAVNRLLSSSEGWAVDALQEHWGKVKASHLEQLPEVARLFADAMDVVADVIYGMKIKAEVELGVMAASVGISIGLAFVTGGLSALIGAAEVAAMREVVRRIIKEAADQIVDQVMAMVTEPVAARLEHMVADAVLDLASGAISPADGSGGGGGKGVSAMNLNSAGGPGGGGGGGGAGRMRIDHVEYDKAAGDLGRISETSLTRLSGSLDRAAGANNRTRGKDPFTQGIDGVVDGATKGMKQAVQRIVKHTGETIPKNIRDTSENHRRNEKATEGALKKIMGDQDGKGGPNSPSKGLGSNRNAAGTKTDLLSKALNDPRHHGVPLGFRKCKNDPVDVATGQMVLSQTDLSLPGVLPLVLKRTHLSDYTYGMWFGRSWASTLDERIEVDIRNKAIWARDDGCLLVYDRLPTPQQPEVLPVEGPRIPLRRTSEFGSAELEFAVVDPESGLTRYFARSHPQGWQLWLITIEDRNGNQIDIHRDAVGMPLSLTHSGGYDVKLTGNREQGRIRGLALRTPEGPESTVQILDYGYDQAGNLTEVVNSSGLPLKFEYDEAGRILFWTDRNESLFRYVYDAAGRVIQTIGPEGFLSSTFTYDTENRITCYTDSVGATTVFHLNDRLQIVAETDPLGHTTHRTWDEHDRPLSVTDTNGHTTELERDEHGNVLAVHSPDGTSTRTHYNTLNLPVEAVSRDGSSWRQEWDDRGNLISATAPDGSVTRITYDDNGAPTSVIGPDGSVQRIVNNRAGLPVEITDPLGFVTTAERDAFGRVISTTDSMGATVSMEWTIEGKPAVRTRPDGTRESWSWDGEGNCTSHTDANGGRTDYSYSHFDQVVSHTIPDGARFDYVNDTELRLRKITNPQGLTWIYEYDAAGNLISETDFDGRTQSYSYDATGRLTSRTTPLGQTIRYAYDSMGRLTTKDADGQVTTYRYDQEGRLLQAVSPTSTLIREYSPLGHLLSESVDGRVIQYEYGPTGLRTARITPTGVVTHYVYDAVGNRTALDIHGHELAFTHDALGQELTRSFGTEHTPVTLAKTWDSMGRPIAQSLGAPDRVLRDESFKYRPDGHLTCITDRLTGTDRVFSLDPIGRPLQVTAANWSENYAYDAAGNQTHAIWPATAPHPEARGERTYTGTRLHAAGAVRYEQDAAGRTTLRQKKRLSHKPDTWRYAYDAEDRLTLCTTPDGARWSYTYDPLGRRTAKHHLADDGETVLESVCFVWDGIHLAEQVDFTTGVTLTWEHDGHHPLAQFERKPVSQRDYDTRFFAIVTDLVGTPTELVDEAGQIAWRTRTTLWGNTAWNTGATAYTPLRFPGQYADLETGLHHNYFRTYDPDTGRYTSPDPLGLAPAPNPATYVDNPLSWCDPLGLSPCDENDVTWGGRVRYGAPGPGGRATSVHATIEPGMTGGKTKPSVKVPGYEKYKGYNKTHLLGAQIGGSNKDPRNFVTAHRYANSPVMRAIEDQIRAAVDKNGETIEYSVTPIYRTNDPSDVIPLGITIEARGNKGFQFIPYGSDGGGTNSVTVLNVPKPGTP